jgi:hypothetical protein
MILRTDVFPDGVIIVRIKQDTVDINGTPVSGLEKVTFMPNGDLPSSDYPQAASIAQILWTPEVIANFQPPTN